MIPLDQGSRQFDAALRFLFAKEPERASLGVVLGCALSSLSVFFEPALRASSIVNVSAMSWWSWLPIGLTIMYIPRIWWLLKKPSVGAYDAVLDAIKFANFTPTEQRRQYRKVIDHRLQQVAVEYTRQENWNATKKKKKKKKKKKARTDRAFD
jgi:hypothetical protein